MRERKKAECTSQEGWELAIPDTDMLTMEDRSILVTCMEQLSDEERQIVMLHAAVGFKHRKLPGLWNFRCRRYFQNMHEP